jgi:hypothetical protein
LTLLKRITEASRPYVFQYRRSSIFVKAGTWILIALIILPDPFDWIPGLAFADEIFYASILIGLLHKYGSVPDEQKKNAKDLLKDILKKDVK